MSEENEAPVWDTDLDDDDLLELLDGDAVDKLINKHVRLAVAEYVKEISLDIDGANITAFELDIVGDEVASQPLLGALEQRLGDYVDGHGRTVGPQSDLDKIKETLAALEAGAALYRDAVARWVVEEYNFDADEETVSPPL